MKKIILLIFAFSIFLFADDLKKGFAEYEKGNHKEALRFFEKSCKNKNQDACFNVALMSKGAVGANVEIDYDKSFKIFKKLCDDKYSLGCVNLSFMYEDGKGVENDYEEAMYYLELSCELKDPLGCGLCGSKYDLGEYIEEDKEKALSYYKKACDLGLSMSCDSYKRLEDFLETFEKFNHLPSR